MVISVMALVGIACIIGGLFLVMTPSLIQRVAMRKVNRKGLTTLFILRGSITLLLFLVADRTDFPIFFRFLGIVGVCKTISIPLMGSRKVEALLRWLVTFPMPVLRLAGGAVIAVGTFFVWSVT